MDLLRVALGLQRGSHSMASRFYEEALRRRDEIDARSIKPYLNNLLENHLSSDKEGLKNSADNFLMLSTLIQNYTRTFL